MDVVRPRFLNSLEVRIRERRITVRFRRLRQGAVSAVSDLADPGRAARAGTPWPHGGRAPHTRARPDTGLVPVPLLQARCRLRAGPVMASARARSGSGSARLGGRGQPTETRIASQLVARPSAPHSTRTPS